MDLSKKEGEEREPRVFINPDSAAASEELSVYEEGCLSIPEYYEEVERPASGAHPLSRPRRQAARGGRLPACSPTCIQHEIDHLNGVLFVDYLSKLKRDRVIKKFSKAAKRATG